MDFLTVCNNLPLNFTFCEKMFSKFIKNKNQFYINLCKRGNIHSTGMINTTSEGEKIFFNVTESAALSPLPIILRETIN